MNNNDRLIRIRYALNLKDRELLQIFTLGGLTLTEAEIQTLLTRTQSKRQTEDGRYEGNVYQQDCDNKTFEAFLNGLITFKRGKRPLKPGEVEKPLPKVLTHQNANNEMLKKIKIALTLTSDDMLGVYSNVDLYLSEAELGSFLRKEGTRNYQMCGDNFARNFLKGLAIAYRGSAD